MSQKLHQLTFKWPATNATQVIVTGTFDNWSKSVTMQRLPEGGFAAQVDVPWDTTIFYKFIQDGNWLIDSQQPHCDDGGGRINNYCTTPKAPAVAANTAAETETTLSADEVEVRPAGTSEPIEPSITVKDHVNETADKAPTVPAPLVEAEVVPLAAAVEHPTDIVPEAATGPTIHADPPASSLPIVEVLPSSDALPTTAPVESATSEPHALDVAAEEETSPAAEAETIPAPVVEASPAPVTEAGPAPTAEVVPAVDEVVYATANTDATADAIVAAAKETAPATTPATVTDVVAPAATEATPAKVDAAVADDQPTASGKPESETPAKVVGEPKDAKAVGEPKDAKAPTTPPAATTKTEETKPIKPRIEGKGSAKSDRHSRTYSSLKGKFFPLDHEKTNGASEHGNTQIQRSVSTKSSPPREKRRSFFGRVASIFKPSS